MDTLPTPLAGIFTSKAHFLFLAVLVSLSLGDVLCQEYYLLFMMTGKWHHLLLVMQSMLGSVVADWQAWEFALAFLLITLRDLGHIQLAQRLLLALNLVITPGSTCRTIRDAGYKAQVGCLQGKHPTLCALPSPKQFLYISVHKLF